MKFINLIVAIMIFSGIQLFVFEKAFSQESSNEETFVLDPDDVDDIGAIVLRDFSNDTQREYGVALLEGSYASQQIYFFNKKIHEGNSGGTITSCKRIIDMPVGVVHGNHSYGGLCILNDHGKEKNIMICRDEMVGHFLISEFNYRAIKELKDYPSIRELTQFVAKNCIGG